MSLLVSLLVHVLVLVLILYLIFQYLLPMIPDATVRMFLTIIVVLIAIVSLLGYIPGWPYWRVSDSQLQTDILRA